MKRRRDAAGALHDVPEELTRYVESEWLPRIDPAGYDQNTFRGISEHRHHGEPKVSREDWRRSQAAVAWTQARHEWFAAHDWPGGVKSIDLLHEAITVRRGPPGGVCASLD